MIDKAALAEINRIAVALDAAGPAMVDKTHQIVKATAFAIEANAKQIVPVDTGTLRNSITTTVDTDDTGASAEVGPEVNYGVYVELGTRRMAPQAYLGPSLDRYSGTFVDALEAAAADVEGLN